MAAAARRARAGKPEREVPEAVRGAENIEAVQLVRLFGEALWAKTNAEFDAVLAAL